MTASCARSWYRLWTGIHATILTAPSCITWSQIWCALERFWVERARAMATLAVRWSVSRVIAGSSTVLSTSAWLISVLDPTDRPCTPVLSLTSHGYAKSLAVCISLSLCLNNRYNTYYRPGMGSQVNLFQELARTLYSWSFAAWCAAELFTTHSRRDSRSCRSAGVGCKQLGIHAELVFYTVTIWGEVVDLIQSFFLQFIWVFATVWYCGRSCLLVGSGSDFSKSASPIFMKLCTNIQHLCRMSLLTFWEVKVKFQGQKRRTEHILFAKLGRGLKCVLLRTVLVVITCICTCYRYF